MLSTRRPPPPPSFIAPTARRSAVPSSAADDDDVSAPAPCAALAWDMHICIYDMHMHICTVVCVHVLSFCLYMG